jgi:hypothetical protein
VLHAVAQVPRAHLLAGAGFAGELRATVAAARKLLKAESAGAWDCVVAAVVLSGRAAAELGTDDGASAAALEYRHVAAALAADTHLMGFATQPPLVKGDELRAALGVPRQRVGAALDVEAAFCLHNPAASRDDVLHYLATALATAGLRDAPQ